MLEPVDEPEVWEGLPGAAPGEAVLVTPPLGSQPVCDGSGNEAKAGVESGGGGV